MPVERAMPPTSRPLGEYLACSRDYIEEALGRQGAVSDFDLRRRIGEILLEAGAVGLEDLLGAVERQRTVRLRACSLFSGLGDRELARLAAVFQEVTIPAGESFIRQDERDPCLYVIAAGTCKVFRTDEAGHEIPLARVFPGEPVGEMGYFDDGVRSASVRAVDVVQCLRATYDDLTDVFESLPAVAAAFMEVITRRLRSTNLLYQQNQYQLGVGDARPAAIAGLLDLARVRDLEGGIDRLLVRMVHSASRLMDAERASLFLVDPASGELWSKVAQGEDVHEIRVPVGSGVVGWCVEHNDLANVEEAYGDARFNADVDRRTGYRTRTVLCAPVRGSAGRVLGAVQVINKHVGVFTEDDESLLRAFAAQAAIAVENVNLFRDVVRGYRRMAGLLEVATEVGRSRDVLGLVVRLGRLLPALFECERGRLLVLDADGETLWCAGPVLDDDPPITRYSRARLVAGEVARSRETVNLPDVYEDERFDPELDREEDWRTRSLLLAPVIDESDRVFGIVELANRVEGVFEDEDVALLKAIVAHLRATVLVNGWQTPAGTSAPGRGR
ncbi:MAG: GAF domain-containing protein [Ectothiorhodospiraceae bacterium]|nr:GAF domain-containing protein [Ectothiorhodospiraceae bacterium]